MADQGGLSDALRQLADNKPAVPDDAHGGPPAGHEAAGGGSAGLPHDPHDGSSSDLPQASAANPPHDDSRDAVAEAISPSPTEHEFHEGAAGDSVGPASLSAPFPSRPPAHDHLKIAAVPVLAVVGLLLLVPGVWAVCMIAGIELWMTRTPEAVMMAWIMLVCWPIAITLLVSAVVIFRQVRRGQ